MTQTLYLRNYQTLRGAGAYLSRLVYDPPAAGTPATAAAIAGIGINSGMVIRDLGVSFVNAAGQNTYRGIDLTATQLAKLTRIRVSLFHTGLYMSRGSAHLGAAGCWFNNVADVDFWTSTTTSVIRRTTTIFRIYMRMTSVSGRTVWRIACVVTVTTFKICTLVDSRDQAPAAWSSAIQPTQKPARALVLLSPGII